MHSLNTIIERNKLTQTEALTHEMEKQLHQLQTGRIVDLTRLQRLVAAYLEEHLPLRTSQKVRNNETS